MAVITPLVINGVEYGAEAFRRGLSGLVAAGDSPTSARTGVLDPRGLAVSLSGSTVRVDGGLAVIGSAKGGYLTGVDSLTNVGTLTASDPTNPRLDRVVLEVLDPDNGSAGTDRLGRLRIITGTPAPIPGLPSLPPLAIGLGQISVPVSGDPVVTARPPLTAAAGAPVPVRDVTDLATVTAWDGRRVSRLDKGGTVYTFRAGKWSPDVEVVDAGSVDANWSQGVRFTKFTGGDGKTQVVMSMLLYRSGGAGFNIDPGTYRTLIGSAASPLIPAGWAPSPGVPVAVGGVVDGPSYGAVSVRANSDGTISIMSLGGTVPISVGNSVHATISWISS